MIPLEDACERVLTRFMTGIWMARYLPQTLYRLHRLFRIWRERRHALRELKYFAKFLVPVAILIFLELSLLTIYFPVLLAQIMPEVTALAVTELPIGLLLGVILSGNRTRQRMNEAVQITDGKLKYDYLYLFILKHEINDDKYIVYNQHSKRAFYAVRHIVELGETGVITTSRKQETLKALLDQFKSKDREIVFTRRKASSEDLH